MNRTSTAVWNGNLTQGSGHITTQSKTLDQSPYSFVSRIENQPGTNPEELLAAAHAGCFTMKLSADLNAAGFTPGTLTTDATVTLDKGVITRSALVVHATVPGISKERFEAIANSAKENCPVSKIYNLEITLETHLDLSSNTVN